MRPQTLLSALIITLSVLLLTACGSSSGGGGGGTTAGATGGTPPPSGSGPGVAPRTSAQSTPTATPAPGASSSDLSGTWVKMPGPADLFVVAKPGDYNQVLDYEMTTTYPDGSSIPGSYELAFGRAVNANGREVFRLKSGRGQIQDYIVSGGWIWWDLDSTGEDPFWKAYAPVAMAPGDFWTFHQVGDYTEIFTCVALDVTAPNGIPNCVHIEVAVEGDGFTRLENRYFAPNRWIVYWDKETVNPVDGTLSIEEVQVGTRPLIGG